MARLSEIRKRLQDNAEAASALADLTDFTTVVTVGTTVSGGALTIPLILAQSGKAASSLFKLAKLFLEEESTGAQSRDPAERADQIFYVFSQRAFLRALRRLEGKLPKTRTLDKDKHQKLVKDLERGIVRPEQAEAAFQFGWNPESGPLQLFDSYKAWIGKLLISMGAAEPETREWLDGVERDARKGLFRELVSKKKDRGWMVQYQLLEQTSTIIDLLKRFPVPTADPSDAAWRVYLESVAAKTSLPIWGEEEMGLGIDRLFVEPKYSYARQFSAGPSTGNPGETAGLRAFLVGLLSRRRPSTEIVFLMGGPGTGKTSVMDVLCGELAKAGTIPIVSVPAKRLDPTRPLLPEVQRFLKDTGFGSIAELIPITEDCILAIDGFDELAHATLSSLESFFRGAQELVRERAGSRLRVLLSGRPTLFADNDVSIPPGAHIVALQPFDEVRVREWSGNWNTATGGLFDGAKYLGSNSKDIQELATQPMLLYLLAKMDQQGEPVPENPTEVGGVRFRVYGQILDWVCRRQEQKSTPDAQTVKLRRFLQVAGLATHQSGQRTLHWGLFKRALELAGLAEPKEIDERAHSTILSFAFTSVENRAWEFTHKSFGEALAAEAIGRVLEDLCEPGRHGEKWKISLPTAVKIWVETFGPHSLTKDLLDFCTGWVQTRGAEFCSATIPRQVDILSHLLGSSSGEQISAVAGKMERPIFTVLGNSSRSWFALTNAMLSVIAESGGPEKMNEWADCLEAEQFRTGAYLSHLASPIGAGEGQSLFAWTSRLVRGRKNRPSRSYLSQSTSLLLLVHEIRRLRPDLLPRTTVKRLAESALFQRGVIVRHPDHDEFYSSEAPFRMSRQLASPLEAVLSDLEDTLQRGYERHPIQDVLEQSGGSVKTMTNTDVERLLAFISRYVYLDPRLNLEFSYDLRFHSSPRFIES